MSKRELFVKFAGKAILWLCLILLIAANILFLNSDGARSLLTRLTNVLGAQSLLRSDEQQRAALYEVYRFWQQVVRDHPDYRDGYIQLALVSYQLELTEESRSYVEKIKSLDPNYPGIKEFEGLLSKE